MIKLENYEVVGWEHAIRGMRNPKNSWEKSDSEFVYESWHDMSGGTYKLGPNDHELVMTLAKGGPVHAKYRRMITVYVDITAPLYWWKEYDTYKVGTVANSCSTMHKIHEKEFTLDDFSRGHLDGEHVCAEYGDETFSSWDILMLTIKALNYHRKKYNEAKTSSMTDEGKRNYLLKKHFDQMIQLLPTSYNQKRTVMLNYEVLANIYKWRKDHKLDEWKTLCEWIKTLPYSEIITGENNL